MGCSGSKLRKSIMENNPLTESEIQQRIEAPREPIRLSIDGINMRCAWVSQRGYYPDAINKDNQDSFTVLPEFTGAGASEQMLLGIFDGHGKDGHHCSRYARDQLPGQIMEHLNKISSTGSSVRSADIKVALRSAHLRTNEMMHSQKRFDDALSGTTSVSLLLRGRTMFVSNVGDSRAVLVSMKDGRLVAKPLSNDQTPYRKDERERIKKTGARILSMDQIEGLEPVHENWGDLNLGEDIDEGGDPPRVWSANGDYPGTAFTRSLGDRVAEACGVDAEPEILERDIHPEDKFIIIASDGVFEFLTNQMVADECARHEDPLAACKAVVAQAYHLWLQYEVRTDDITMIAMYLDEIAPASPPGTSSGDSLQQPGTPSRMGPNGSPMSSRKISRQTSIEINEQRPVRRVMSREKRKHMIEVQLDPLGDEQDEDLTEEEMKTLIIPKNPTDSALISSAIKANFLFQHLNASQCGAVVDVMREVTVKAGDRVIRQGDRGDRFYVIDHGRFEVRVRRTLPPTAEELAREKERDVGREKSMSIISVDRAPSAGRIQIESNPEALGSVVHVYESNASSHPGFGELSLMYGKPRAASVIALTDGKLWALDRRVFARVVLRPKDLRRTIFRILKKIDLLKCLSLAQLQRLTDLLSEQSYAPGDVIVKQGEVEESLFIILTGDCQVSEARFFNSSKSNTLTLKSHDYFGERALLETKPRTSTVTATTAVTAMYISKAAFEQVMGPLAQIIDNDRLRREAIAVAASSAQVPHKFSDVTVYGIVTTDVLGTLFMGTFGVHPLEGTAAAPKKVVPNVTVRTFLLSQVERKSLKDSLARFMDAVKAILASPAATNPVLIPRPLSFIRDTNAVHITFNQPIVADLSSFIRSNTGAITATTEMTAYAFACLVVALETLHTAQVVYRAVQPESIYIDSRGRVVLMDYRVCKVGLASNGRTFTICGVSDYLSPEQIAQCGHSYPVDLWGMGVLLYEMEVGSLPFTASSEVATYSKISSFGTNTFPALPFPADSVSEETRSLITQLVVPTPASRIGFTAIKQHPFFSAYSELWSSIANGTVSSPFAAMAKNENDAMMAEVVDPSEFEPFSKEYSGRAMTDDWVNSLGF